MSTAIQIDTLRPSEEDDAIALIENCFDAHVRHDCTPEGVEEFRRASCMMVHECPSNHFNLVAKKDGSLVGIVNVRDACHFCLFFVADAYLRQGIGRALFDKAVIRCKEDDPGVKLMDVNASLFAVPFYESLGFECIGSPKSKNGITFQEMRISLWRKRPSLVEPIQESM